MTDTSRRHTILAVLRVLKEHSDIGHKMLQSDILNCLNEEHQICLTRKTLRQHLNDLVDAGYPIAYDYGWYYEAAFCNVELDTLYTSVLFNSFIPGKQRSQLLSKIKALGNAYYTPKLAQQHDDNRSPQFMYTMEILQSAIDAKQKVQFKYGHYDIDKALHPRMDADGNAHIYIFNPYRIVMTGGRFYVIGNVDQYDNIAHFRLDRVLDCVELDTPAKSMMLVKGLEHGLNIPQYMMARPYMFTGEGKQVRLRIQRCIVGDILDWFGMDVQFENATEDSVDAVFEADESTLYYWMKQYDEFVIQSCP